MSLQETHQVVLGSATHGLIDQPSPPLYPEYRAPGFPEAHAGHSSDLKLTNDDFNHKSSFDTASSSNSEKQQRNGHIGTFVSGGSNLLSPGIEVNSKLSRGGSGVTQRGLERSAVNGHTGAPSQDLAPVPGRKHEPLLLAQALKLPRRRKRRGIRSRLAGSFAPTQLVNSLKGRDHVCCPESLHGTHPKLTGSQVFVVDLAPSMEVHKSLMEEWLEVLGYMVQNADPDDMEVYFTGSSKRSRAKSWNKLLSKFRHQTFEDTTRRPHLFEVPHLINQILEDYQNRLTETHCIKRFFRIGSWPRKGPRRMSIYVLTNGDWGKQNDLEKQIRALVEGLCKHEKRNKQVAIQFLRFGNIPQGIRNLERLDRLDRRLGFEL